LYGEIEKVDSFDFNLLKNAGIAYKIDRTIDLTDSVENDVVIKGDNIVDLYREFAKNKPIKVVNNTVKILEEVFNG
jgi:hypothetical protein